MQDYFVRANTNLGPCNFYVEVAPGGKLWPVINAEARRRGIVVCSDWTATPVSRGEAEYAKG